MAKKSVGILLYRFRVDSLEVMLVHPGGPFWQRKDAGAWSVPKGELEENEEPLQAAIRELTEETGIIVSGDFLELTAIKQKSGKIIYVWAIQKDVDVSNITSNVIELEWPPKSGKKIVVPEVDKAAWFSAANARIKIIPGQAGFIEELERKLNDK